MPESWTTPRTWTNGETVTEQEMNTHVRDNLLYLKGILTGSNLQEVTLANDRNLRWRDAGGNAQSVIKVDAQNYVDIMPADATKPIRFINKAFDFTMASIDDGGRSIKLDNNAFRTHRHPRNNDRHVEGGVVAVGAVGNGAIVNKAVTFTNAFASVPTVQVTNNGQTGGDPYATPIVAHSISTTGFTIGVRGTGGAVSALSVGWLAEGQD